MIIIKKVVAGILVLASVSLGGVSAAEHIVKKGDTMWKIASKYQVGISEIKSANPQIGDINLIYPGQVIMIPNPDSKVQSYESEVIRLVNEERAKKGLSALQADWQLSRVARFKSQDMRDKKYFSHQSPTYGSPFEMIKNFGISFKAAGENIAYGYKTPQAVVDSWMNSPGHRTNILSSTYNKIGVGYVESGNYWTQMFIKQ